MATYFFLCWPAMAENECIVSFQMFPEARIQPVNTSHEFIRRFSAKCNSLDTALPGISFLDGIKCKKDGLDKLQCW
jgi:hypothetical protein